MHAAIFDIDGTLLQSNTLDDETYLAALHEVVGPLHLRKSWTLYGNISGSGALLEILADNEIVDRTAALGGFEKAFVGRISSYLASHASSKMISVDRCQQMHDG